MWIPAGFKASAGLESQFSLRWCKVSVDGAQHCGGGRVSALQKWQQPRCIKFWRQTPKLAGMLRHVVVTGHCSQWATELASNGAFLGSPLVGTFLVLPLSSSQFYWWLLSLNVMPMDDE